MKNMLKPQFWPPTSVSRMGVAFVVFTAALAPDWVMGQALSPNPQSQAISPLAPETATNPGNGKNPANSPASAAQGGTQLQKVVVEAASPDATTLPTRPTDAVNGLGDTVQDTPRSIYQVSKLQLEFDPVNNATDLARYSPSVDSVTSQGISGVPYIRGFSSEVYQDGFRIGRSLRPFDATTSYQSLDIVPGPASVIYGPSSKSSGYIDWTTKEPLFDANHTQVDLLFGTFDEGGQGGHANFYQQIDNSGPINSDLAYRVAYKQNEADSYYQGAHNNFEHVYAALTWLPTKNIFFSSTSSCTGSFR
jgi:outer membrane receptor protein involved in Fe transport